MSTSPTLNIIIAGTGGRGVISLSNIIRKLAHNKELKCEGASFKGGAQRMGSVHSELRILKEGYRDINFSSQIPIGAVDVLLGLEPWEALRFANKCNSNTRAIITSSEEKLYVERYRKTATEDPIENIRSVYNSPIIKNYSKFSKEQTGGTKNTNFLIIEEAIKNGYLPFSLEDLNSIKI